MNLALALGGLLLAAPLAVEAEVVEVGLDVVAGQQGGLLRGKRVGLLCHAASVAADGRHAVEVLRGVGVDVRRLFAPEHGLRGQLAAGADVPSGRDPESGLPVVSLYGSKTAPSSDDLRELDALAVDLQDAGVRFYSYAGTMLLALAAASRRDLEVILLDRPNPLGGELTEGPPSEPGEVAPGGLLALAPGPLIHGLTLGELARFANARSARPARLQVVPMRGWRRAMAWSATGRRWIPPSPNLRTAEAALTYPGMCLLEATNVSEGRGTDAPFLVLGAPWLDVAALRREVSLPGFTLEDVSFTPRGSAAAPEPKYAGLACRGLRVRVGDERVASPYRLGVTLLWALRHAGRFVLRDEGRALDRLLGTPRLRRALERGEGVDAILGADLAATETFRRERREALLYD